MNSVQKKNEMFFVFDHGGIYQCVAPKHLDILELSAFFNARFSDTNKVVSIRWNMSVNLAISDPGTETSSLFVLFSDAEHDWYFGVHSTSAVIKDLQDCLESDIPCLFESFFDKHVHFYIDVDFDNKEIRSVKMRFYKEIDGEKHIDDLALAMTSFYANEIWDIFPA